MKITARYAGAKDYVTDLRAALKATRGADHIGGAVG